MRTAGQSVLKLAALAGALLLVIYAVQEFGPVVGFLISKFGWLLLLFIVVWCLLGPELGRLRYTQQTHSRMMYVGSARVDG